LRQFIEIGRGHNQTRYAPLAENILTHSAAGVFVTGDIVCPNQLCQAVSQSHVVGSGFSHG
jgi:hypothetical protein